MRSATFLLGLSLLLGMAGCQQNPTTTSPSGAGGPATSSGSSADVTTGGVGEDDVWGTSTDAAGAGAGAPSLLDERIIYFDFDKSAIRPEFTDILQAHGQYIAEHPNVGVRFEGHADERGSREYNIGLGERRAQAVRRVVLLYGAGSNQITTVSYGEERPADSRSSESAWERNRRVEIVYTQ